MTNEEKLKAERDEARANCVPGLTHEVLTTYGAPNGHGLTMLGRIEALADKSDRNAERRKLAESERDALRGEVAELQEWRDVVWDEYRGEVAVLRKALERIKSQAFDSMEGKGNPAFQEFEFIMCVAHDALASGSGKPETAKEKRVKMLKAEVIAAAEKQAALHRKWLAEGSIDSDRKFARLRHEQAAIETDKAVERMKEARS